MRGLILILLAAGLVVTGTACQAPAQPGGPTQMVLRIDDYETYFDDALTLLREHDFAVSRADRDRGTVVTRPTTSGQWFEIWRGDSRGGYNVLESSLHTMRRTISVTIAQRPGGPAGEYDVTVEAQKERFSSPERQVTTASGALQIYSERLPTTEGLRAGRGRGDHWVALGRDELLEQYLLDRLARLRTDAQRLSEEPSEDSPSAPMGEPAAEPTPTPAAEPSAEPTPVIRTLPTDTQ